MVENLVGDKFVPAVAVEQASIVVAAFSALTLGRWSKVETGR